MQSADTPISFDDTEITHLAGSARDALLTRFRHTQKPWAQLTEQQQHEVSHNFEQASKDLVRAVVRKLTSYDFPRVVVRLGDVKIKGGEKAMIEAKVIADHHDEYVAIMGSKAGTSAVLLFVDSDTFLNARPAVTDPDEPPLPFAEDPGDGEPVADGSALGDSYREGERVIAAEEALAAAAAKIWPDKPHGERYPINADTVFTVVAQAQADGAMGDSAFLARVLRNMAGLAENEQAVADATGAPTEEEFNAMVQRQEERAAALRQQAELILNEYDPDDPTGFTLGELEQIAAEEAADTPLDPPPSEAELLLALRDVVGVASPPDELTGDGSGNGEALPEVTPETAGEEREAPPAGQPAATPEQATPPATPEQQPEQATGDDGPGAQPSILQDDAAPAAAPRGRGRTRKAAATDA